jgi:hypothetical protein
MMVMMMMVVMMMTPTLSRDDADEDYPIGSSAGSLESTTSLFGVGVAVLMAVLVAVLVLVVMVVVVVSMVVVVVVVVVDEAPKTYSSSFSS